MRGNNTMRSPETRTDDESDEPPDEVYDCEPMRSLCYERKHHNEVSPGQAMRSPMRSLWSQNSLLEACFLHNSREFKNNQGYLQTLMISAALPYCEN